MNMTMQKRIPRCAEWSSRATGSRPRSTTVQLAVRHCSHRTRRLKVDAQLNDSTKVDVPTVRKDAQQQQRDDKDVAALQAGISAINQVLGLYNKLQGGKKQQHQQRQRLQQQGAGGAGKQSPASRRPGKMVTFSAQGTASRDVQELLLAANLLSDSSDTSGGSSSTATSSHPDTCNGSPTNGGTAAAASATSSSGGSSGGSSSAASSAAGPDADSAEWRRHPRSLVSYLSLPLEDYSVLDPTWVEQLGSEMEFEARLQELRQARQQRVQQQAKQQREAVEAAGGPGPVATAPPGGSAGSLSGDSSSSVGTASNGGSASSSGSASSGGGAGSSSGQGGAAGVVMTSGSVASNGGSSSSGVFVLRVPLREIAGVDLDPQLLIRVAVDRERGQVRFSTDRLWLGDPRLDGEFTLNLAATMASTQLKPPQLVGEGTGSAGGGSSSTSATSSSTARTSSSSPGNAASLQAAPHTAAGHGAAAAGTATAQAAAAGEAGALAAPPGSLQQLSKLQCQVEVSFALRVPHPLSMVPGPLLSSTGSMLARLTMRALLPSFLDMLSADYARWASGASTSSRRATPAGSLIGQPGGLGGLGHTGGRSDKERVAAVP